MSFVLLSLASVLAADTNPFLFQENDRVLLIGGTLIEREQKYGDWELALTLLNKDKKVTFRNLGWSGDTVWGESRNFFDANPAGYQRLTKMATELKPNVIVICYGQNESYAGAAGLAAFVAQYQKLIDDLRKTKARIIILTPPPFEKTPNHETKNQNLKAYTEAIVKLSDEKGCHLFDFHQAVSSVPVIGLTDNGVHYSPDGYRVLSSIFHPGLPMNVKTEQGLKPLKYEPNASKLPTPANVVLTLPEGAEALRARIVAKNELFFHRWRPQNETYLFGFRKREQGQNAKEVEEFEKLVNEADRDIHSQLTKIK